MTLSRTRHPVPLPQLTPPLVAPLSVTMLEEITLPAPAWIAAPTLAVVELPLTVRPEMLELAPVTTAGPPHPWMTPSRITTLLTVAALMPAPVLLPVHAMVKPDKSRTTSEAVT